MLHGTYRPFLDKSHRYRLDKKNFDNTKEFGCAPQPLSGYDVLGQLDGYENITFGKPLLKLSGHKRKRDDAKSLSLHMDRKKLAFSSSYLIGKTCW